MMYTCIVALLLLGLGTDLGSGGRNWQGGSQSSLTQVENDESVPFMCETPPGFAVGEWCIGKDNKECTSVVKELCYRQVRTARGDIKYEVLRDYTTSAWRPGKRVKDNCNSVPSYTAIANFYGPGNTFDGNNKDNGHAAIFIGCTSEGLQVYDQARGINSRLSVTTKEYGSSIRTYNGDHFYTIDIDPSVTPKYNSRLHTDMCRHPSPRID